MTSEIIVEFPSPLTDKEKKMIYGCKGEVVRCKDCKHYRTRWVGFCELIGNENIHREDDDFCSRGERK